MHVTDFSKPLCVCVCAYLSLNILFYENSLNKTTACAMEKGGCFIETDYGYVAAVLDRTALWIGRQLNKMTANGWMTAGEETSMTATVFHTPGAERAESTQMASWLGKTTYVNACQTHLETASSRSVHPQPIL